MTSKKPVSAISSPELTYSEKLEICHQIIAEVEKYHRAGFFNLRFKPEYFRLEYTDDQPQAIKVIFDEKFSKGKTKKTKKEIPLTKIKLIDDDDKNAIAPEQNPLLKDSELQPHRMVKITQNASKVGAQNTATYMIPFSTEADIWKLGKLFESIGISDSNIIRTTTDKNPEKRPRLDILSNALNQHQAEHDKRKIIDNLMAERKREQDIIRSLRIEINNIVTKTIYDESAIEAISRLKNIRENWSKNTKKDRISQEYQMLKDYMEYELSYKKSKGNNLKDNKEIIIFYEKVASENFLNNYFPEFNQVQKNDIKKIATDFIKHENNIKQKIAEKEKIMQAQKEKEKLEKEKRNKHLKEITSFDRKNLKKHPESESESSTNKENRTTYEELIDARSQLSKLESNYANKENYIKEKIGTFTKDKLEEENDNLSNISIEIGRYNDKINALSSSLCKKQTDFLNKHKLPDSFNNQYFSFNEFNSKNDQYKNIAAYALLDFVGQCHRQGLILNDLNMDHFRFKMDKNRCKVAYINTKNVFFLNKSSNLRFLFLSDSNTLSLLDQSDPRRALGQHSIPYTLFSPEIKNKIKNPSKKSIKISLSGKSDIYHLSYTLEGILDPSTINDMRNTDPNKRPSAYQLANNLKTKILNEQKSRYQAFDEKAARQREQEKILKIAQDNKSIIQDERYDTLIETLSSDPKVAIKIYNNAKEKNKEENLDTIPQLMLEEVNIIHNLSLITEAPKRLNSVTLGTIYEMRFIIQNKISEINNYFDDENLVPSNKLKAMIIKKKTLEAYISGTPLEKVLLPPHNEEFKIVTKEAYEKKCREEKNKQINLEFNLLFGKSVKENVKNIEKLKSQLNIEYGKLIETSVHLSKNQERNKEEIKKIQIMIESLTNEIDLVGSFIEKPTKEALEQLRTQIQGNSALVYKDIRSILHDIKINPTEIQRKAEEKCRGYEWQSNNYVIQEDCESKLNEILNNESYIEYINKVKSDIQPLLQAQYDKLDQLNTTESELRENMDAFMKSKAKHPHMVSSMWHSLPLENDKELIAKKEALIKECQDLIKAHKTFVDDCSHLKGFPASDSSLTEKFEALEKQVNEIDDKVSNIALNKVFESFKTALDALSSAAKAIYQHLSGDKQDVQAAMRASGIKKH